MAVLPTIWVGSEYTAGLDCLSRNAAHSLLAPNHYFEIFITVPEARPRRPPNFCPPVAAEYTGECTIMPQKVHSVFLSYARSDRDLVQKIGQELREAGLEVWDPEQNILPGANWMAELKAALDSASALVVFISPDAMASRSVSYEIEYALGAKHLRGRLIPVTIRPTKDAPWILNSLQSVQYQSPGKTGRQIVELLGQPHDAPEAKSRTH